MRQKKKESDTKREREKGGVGGKIEKMRWREREREE